MARKQQHFELYMKEGCPYSLAAQQQLQQRKLPVELLVVPQQDLERVKKAHRMETFPQIFLVDPAQTPPKKLVGGYDDLMNYLAAKQ